MWTPVTKANNDNNFRVNRKISLEMCQMARYQICFRF